MWAQELNGYHRSGSRLRATAICLGGIALIYGGSFFTRDWRAPKAHLPGQPLAEQAAVRPIRAAARPVVVETTDSVAAATPRIGPEVTSAAVETTRSVAASTPSVGPEVTGALPKASPTVSPPASANSGRLAAPRPSSKAPPHTLAQAAAAHAAAKASPKAPPRTLAQAAAPKRAVKHARLHTERVDSRRRVQHARLRARPVAWRQVAGFHEPRADAMSPQASPFAQLFQLFLPPGVR